MTISKEDVLYTAALSRLKFTEEECLMFQEDLNNVLKYFEKLNELDTEGISPTAHVVHLRNRFREDKAEPSIDRQLALKNASSVKDGCFKVPKIIE